VKAQHTDSKARTTSRDVGGFVNSSASPRLVLCVTLNHGPSLLTDLH